MTFEELEAEALKLDPAARAKLAEQLTKSLQEISDNEKERLWIQEAMRRSRELRESQPHVPPSSPSPAARHEAAKAPPKKPAAKMAPARKARLSKKPSKKRPVPKKAARKNAAPKKTAAKKAARNKAAPRGTVRKRPRL